MNGNLVETKRFTQSRTDILQDQMDAFVATLENQVDVRLATADDGLRAVAVGDAAREASARAKRVDVNYAG